MICRKCGEKNPDNITYCKYCGGTLGTDELNQKIFETNNYSQSNSAGQSATRVIISIACYALLFSFLLPINVLFGIFYGIKHRSKELPAWTNKDTATRVGAIIGDIFVPALVGVVMFPYWTSKFICGLVFK